MMRLSLLAAAAALLLVPAGASALSVSAIDAPAAFASAPAASSVTLPAGAAWTSIPSPRIVAGSDANVYRSPFDMSGTGWEKIKYFVVGPKPNDPSTAILTFGGDDQKGMSFLWGSPDSYNSLSFFLNGNAVPGASITGAHGGLGMFSNSGKGAAFVTISGLIFDEVRFASPTQQAFEFSNLNFTPVPLPAAAWLLIAGVAGFGFFRRKTTV